MSGCGGNCNCGSSCSCTSCGKMYPDMETAMPTKVTIIENPVKRGSMNESDGEKSFGAEGGNGCKCGSSCTCDPCTC
ncbi:OLC1v1018476C1 [Oldenlandia corymbosa var. corymbosa]|uniref:Metallothionein-like protein n=2 Tax=Oldenlandia corymbosa var. corymbosa TaxID=529605 RepID=A0AAV1EBP6_OLDCO|nr:OLC1v1018476C1 [Oldenlandia corymbosa var. corymbosa]